MDGSAARSRSAYVVITALVATGMVWALTIALRTGAAAQANPGDSPLPGSEPRSCSTGSTSVPEFNLVLAAYQAWFGLDNHIKPPPYISTDTAVISGHIAAALDRGIGGFAVDWYGPEAGALNDQERAFIDEATRRLLQQSEGRGFHIALMYDEGTVRTAETITTAYESRVISDLLYARHYFTMPAYLHINEYPALFVFPYPDVDPYIDWARVREQLNVTVTLLDEDPNPYSPTHDAQFDGFYAWVQPTAGQWLTDCTEWGEGYLRWFYETMASPPYADKVTVGAVWPGFDDSLAPWGSGRCMWPRCGQTWRDTWSLAVQYNPPIVMIDTWNDFEEDTDIEYGTGECLTPPREQCALPGRQVVYTYTLANTGKFTDTFTVEAHPPNTWPTVINPTHTTLLGHSSTTLVVTLTVPETTAVGTSNLLVVTAMSELSPAVHSSLVDTTTTCGGFLPLILKNETWRSIEILGPAEVHDEFADVYGTWAGFPVDGVTVRLYAEENNHYWCIQPEAANLTSDQWTAAGQFGAPTTYGVFAVVASGDGNQLPGCAAPPGENYIIAPDDEQFRADIRPCVCLGDSRAISPRFVITRVE